MTLPDLGHASVSQKTEAALEPWIAQWARESLDLATELHDQVGPVLASLSIAIDGLRCEENAELTILRQGVSQLSAWLAHRRAKNQVELVRRLGLADSLHWFLAYIEGTRGAVLAVRNKLAPERVTTLSDIAMFGAATELVDALVRTDTHHGTLELSHDAGALMLEMLLATSNQGPTPDYAALGWVTLVRSLGGAVQIDARDARTTRARVRVPCP